MLLNKLESKLETSLSKSDLERNMANLKDLVLLLRCTHFMFSGFVRVQRYKCCFVQVKLDKHQEKNLMAFNGLWNCYPLWLAGYLLPFSFLLHMKLYQGCFYRHFFPFLISLIVIVLTLFFSFLISHLIIYYWKKYLIVK